MDRDNKESLSDDQLVDYYAVIIGIGDYKDTRIPKLEFARADARAIYNLLIDENRVGISKDNIKLLIDDGATSFSIKNAISGFIGERKSKLVFRNILEYSKALETFNDPTSEIMDLINAHLVAGDKRLILRRYEASEA